MKPSSSPSIPLSSASKLPYVSFFDKYETIFQCDGGSCITEDKDVSMYPYHQSRSDEATDGQHNNSNHQITTTEALHLNVSSSYQGASSKQQKSPPPVLTTVMYKHQASSYNNDEDTFDIDERRIQSRTKAAHTEAANNEYFNNRIQQLQVLIHNNSSEPTQITQLTLPLISSPDTTTQQQQQRHEQQQQCQCHSPTPSIKSNKTYATRSPKLKSTSKPVQYEMCTVEMPSNFRVLKEQGRQQHGRSGNQTDDSESTQSTQSMSESEGDDLSSLESHVGGRPGEEDTPIMSILRRRTVVKCGTNADTTTKAHDRKRGRVVRFEKETQFPDPNERPSSTRKHVPRMSQRQKQDYDRIHNTTDPRRRRSAPHQQQPTVSSLLIQLFLQHRPL